MPVLMQWGAARTAGGQESEGAAHPLRRVNSARNRTVSRRSEPRPGHGSPDPNNPTQPARKKPDPTRPELRGGWARAVFFDPQQSTGRARAVIFDPKPDPTRKTRPKGQKTRPNPKKTRPDTPAQGARANPTRPGDRYGSGAGRPMRPVTRP